MYYILRLYTAEDTHSRHQTNTLENLMFGRQLSRSLRSAILIGSHWYFLLYLVYFLDFCDLELMPFDSRYSSYRPHRNIKFIFPRLMLYESGIYWKSISGNLSPDPKGWRPNVLFRENKCRRLFVDPFYTPVVKPYIPKAVRQLQCHIFSHLTSQTTSLRNV